VTRSIRPEISSVTGLRSVVAAFIWMGIHFPMDGPLPDFGRGSRDACSLSSSHTAI
jgi:hypothetical protein